MANKLEEHYKLLQNEIYDITKNIHKVKKKTHHTMSTIVKNLKYITKEIKPVEVSSESNENLFMLTKMNQTEYATINNKNLKNLKYNNYLRTYSNQNSSKIKQIINTKANYKKYQPVIHLYKNYKNNNNKSCINFNSPPNKKFNNTIDNCITVAKDKFFVNRTSCNVNNENNSNKLFFKDSFDIAKNNNKNRQNYSQKEEKTIDFNINFNKTIQSEINYKNKNGIINFNNNIKNNLNIHSKRNYREYYWNNETEKLNDSINNKDREKIKNNIFFGNYNHQSMKYLNKKKLNSFKEKSDTFYKKISNKSKIIGKTDNIEENKINKSFMKINNLKSNKYSYNSINVENQKIKKVSRNFQEKEKKYFSENKNRQNIRKMSKCFNYRENLAILNEFYEQKKFINKVLKIYNKYNEETEKGQNYEKILLWINYLIYSKQRNKSEAKYEFFCKQLMKENNIKDFSIFQSFARNIINEKRNANIFLEDIKKILSVEDCIIKDKNKSKKIQEKSLIKK